MARISHRIRAPKRNEATPLARTQKIRCRRVRATARHPESERPTGDGLFSQEANMWHIFPSYCGLTFPLFYNLYRRFSESQLSAFPRETTRAHPYEAPEVNAPRTRRRCVGGSRFLRESVQQNYIFASRDDDDVDVCCGRTRQFEKPTRTK
jgi:hypothetical protein